MSMEFANAEGLGGVRKLTPDERRHVGLVCAGYALDQDEPDVWLGDVLDMLGLR